MRTWINTVQNLIEKRETWDIGVGAGKTHPVDVLINPSKREIMGLFAKTGFAYSGAPRLRGVYFPSDRLMIVGQAHEIVHYQIEQTLGSEDEAHDVGGDEPYSGRFYLEMDADNRVIFIGNPPDVFTDPRARSLFDLIDVPTGDRTEYAPSSWGVPAREWDHLVG
jgi:hypothetical protein